jgi:hypothetical protein
LRWKRRDNQTTNFWSKEIEVRSIEKSKSQATRDGNKPACNNQRNGSKSHQNKAQLSKRPSIHASMQMSIEASSIHDREAWEQVSMQPETKQPAE